MLNRIFRQTYGLAGLSIFVAIVLAGCPAAPGSIKPTVSKEVEDIASLAVGRTATVDIRGVFKGEKLTYSVRSSDLSIAAANIASNNQSVTIRAVGAGEATITVTATNAGGSASQAFKVTVPQPAPPTTPTTPVTPPTTPTTPETPEPQGDCTLSESSLEITVRVIRETSKQCTIPDGHVLQYDGDGVQEHHIEGNTWSITAKLKGSHVVHLVNEQDGTRPGSITVIVPNTPPTLKSSVEGPIGTGDSEAPEDLIAGTASEGIKATAPLTNGINPGQYFDDADIPDNRTDDSDVIQQGKFRFRVFEKPDEVLIRTHRGFIAVRKENRGAGDSEEFTSALTSVSVETEAIILKDPKPHPDGKLNENATYQIRVSAYDGDNERSDSPVTLEFKTERPQQKTYNLIKSGTTYKRPKIGNRIGVEHTINLSNTADDGIADYNFLDFITDTKITEKIKSSNPSSTATGDLSTNNGVCTGASKDAASPSEVAGITTEGSGCWSSTISGSEASGTFTPGDTPTVTFVLGTDRRLNDSGDVTITIRYWVVANEAVTADLNADPPVRGENLRIVEVGRRSLTLDIHSCVEFSDCP